MNDDLKKYEHKNHAKIEFLTIKDEIESLFDKGLSFVGAYRYFLETKRITMCYDTFRRYIKKYKIDLFESNNKQINKENIVQNKQNNIAPLKLGTSNASIIHTNDPNTKGLID